MGKPLVGIVMGSRSDAEIMEEAAKVLQQFGVEYETEVASAHRSPARTKRYAEVAARRGIKVIIAGAGGAAHLAGVVAAHTVLPVIAVPLNSPLRGLDSFLATFQMPGGIPVATMGIGRSGAKNAALLAIGVLALSRPQLVRKLKRYRKEMAKKIVS